MFLYSSIVVLGCDRCYVTTGAIRWLLSLQLEINAPPPSGGSASDSAPDSGEILNFKGGGSLFAHQLPGQDPASAGQNRHRPSLRLASTWTSEC